MREYVATAKTVEEAIQLGCEALSVDRDDLGVSYEILEMPKKGTVTLNEAEGDVFVYTPNTGKTGKDSFTFCVEDENGNVSAPATVKVENPTPSNPLLCKTD